MALYEATDGANWTSNDNWLNNAPLGEWHGVITDRNGRVTGLDLRENQLTGEIPAELGSLSNLEWVYLHGNQLRGTIPPDLGSLTNLELLDLIGNQLSGEIPPELGSLSNLRSLYLDGNELTGEIPPELGSLSNLIQLWLYENQLGGEIPAELGNLVNLQELFLSENQLSGCVPTSLRDQLDMDHSNLGGLPFCEGTPTAQLTAAEVYSLVSPSIPFIETPTGTGSGVLIEGGYVVTNYHVVWPYQAVWVVFPDDQVLQNVPVVGWDSMADLAVLGPVDVPARPLGVKGGGPLQLGDGEDLAPGSELFLVGYPAEVDELPEPSITRGILSRFREWERLGMTYLQTDAAIAGGQSGGALVDSQGQVVGISTFSFSEAGFGLATSAADIAPIVERLIQGEYTSGLGDRRLPAGGVAFEFYVDLANVWDSRTFVLDATAGTILQAEIDGPEDGLFRVYDPSGLLLEVDGVATGIESGTVELLVDGVHFLQVELFAGESASFDLTSTVGLKPFHDPDDGRTIAVGETVVGNLDFFFDLDWYSIRLEEGETVRISTDSINVDTLLAVDFPNSRDDQVVSDDDSGGGLSGLNSELVYRAPNTGEYFIVVTDAVGDSFGGYYLSVERAPVGTETVHVPTGSQVVEGQGVESPFGEMLVLEDPLGYFEVQVPAHWVEETDSSDGKVFEAHDPEGNGGILIYVEEGVLVSLTEYADALESELLEGQKVITREIVQTAQGLPAAILEYSFDVDGDVVSGTALIYLSDGGKAIFITYVFPAAQFDAGRELAYYSFDTFTATATATPMPAPASTDTAYAGLLRTIPDTPELRQQVYINDYALVRQVFDIPLPGPGDDEDALVEFSEWLRTSGFAGEADDPPARGFGAISFFGPFNQYRNITAENLQHLAFDVRIMDQSIVAGSPPTILDVVRGRFDPQATDKALESCSECEPHSREEYGGVSYYSWGEDYAFNPQLRFAPPAFDWLGRGGRIAVLDEYVFRTLGTPDMEALIETGLNEGASLADVEEFRLLAGGMSRLGAYTMLLSDDVEVWDVDDYATRLLGADATLKQVEQVQRAVLSGPWLRPYEAFATGAGKDENGRYMTLVLVHADDASAEENVGLLRRIIEEEGSVLNDALWSDYIDVERSEIHTEGRALLAKLRGGFANNWLSWVIQRDGLILHE